MKFLCLSALVKKSKSYLLCTFGTFYFDRGSQGDIFGFLYPHPKIIFLVYN